MRRLLTFLLLFSFSGCAYGSSVAVVIGPKFTSDKTSWNLGLEFVPFAHFPIKETRQPEYGEPRGRDTFGLPVRTFAGVATDFSQIDGIVGVGLGFNYMTATVMRQPAFDLHLGMQGALLIGKEIRPAIGPHVGASLRVGELLGSSLMVGISVDCLLASNAPGCGPMGEVRLTRFGGVD